MKTKFLLLMIAIAIFSTQCKKGNGTGNNGGGNDNDTITKLDPVETDAANTNYPPAFSGQTRTFGIKTYTPLKVDILNSTLSNPWGIAILPDGRLLITQKAGTMVILSSSGVPEHTISGLPAVNAGGQGGLLDVALDPDFSNNRMIYWTFAQNVSGGTLTAVAKGRLANSETSIESATVIYQAMPAYNGTLHYGGRLLFDNQGYLLVSTGERSDLATRPLAQALNNALGKILRITKDGQPAPGNPFQNTTGALPEIYSYGHRNVQGMALDKLRNVLWETEFGPLGGDEVNMIQPNKNYGWPVITYGLEYSGATIGGGITQKAGMEQPVYYWDPVVSPSGMIFYHSDYIPEWKDNLLIAALSGSHIVRLRIVNNKIAGEERLLTGQGQRFRAIAQSTNGMVYIVTDQGRLYRITKQ
ncbi:glucose dehydrogenase [Taibaiella sp. KBW10]|uniref:PQQ-dependent sugar dehydrogenase n=1 Tax=Taibaiella sp. KBW10 TaxID=2153357 RepID=UPI000F59EBBB|nr:PQQ-dependent sugar dehydrogenase [Taibaiella sp. KBW10]RQO30001.1 glucose dehydrogenase [Taibaiella sp. KBW10]